MVGGGGGGGGILDPVFEDPVLVDPVLADPVLADHVLVEPVLVGGGVLEEEDDDDDDEVAGVEDRVVVLFCATGAADNTISCTIFAVFCTIQLLAYWYSCWNANESGQFIQ